MALVDRDVARKLVPERNLKRRGEWCHYGPRVHLRDSVMLQSPEELFFKTTSTQRLQFEIKSKTGFQLG